MDSSSRKSSKEKVEFTPVRQNKWFLSSPEEAKGNQISSIAHKLMRMQQKDLSRTGPTRVEERVIDASGTSSSESISSSVSYSMKKKGSLSYLDQVRNDLRTAQKN